MYNFLKYKHNWKRCSICSGKMKRDKAFWFSTMYQCQKCEKEIPACELKKVPMKRRFYPKGNAKTRRIRYKFYKLAQKYRVWRAL